MHRGVLVMTYMSVSSIDVHGLILLSCRLDVTTRAARKFSCGFLASIMVSQTPRVIQERNNFECNHVILRFDLSAEEFFCHKFG
ncbi:hypothetical protein V6N12_062027 [Hibiscus sabdariffa]|uniref:Secreted protein n=1 Tax=Hibiscus sabdariffa TaxID=183260 RepID=A0ABR2DZC0_9ROSI